MKNLILASLAILSKFRLKPTINAERLVYNPYKGDDLVKEFPNNIGLYEAEEFVVFKDTNNDTCCMNLMDLKLIGIEYLYKYITGREIENQIHTLTELGDKQIPPKNTFYLSFLGKHLKDSNIAIMEKYSIKENEYLSEIIELETVFSYTLPSKKHRVMSERFIYETGERNFLFIYNENTIYKYQQREDNNTQITKYVKVESDPVKVDEYLTARENSTIVYNMKDDYLTLYYPEVLSNRYGKKGCKWEVIGTIKEYVEDDDTAFALLEYFNNPDELIWLNFYSLPLQRYLKGDSVILYGISEGLTTFEENDGNSYTVPIVKVEAINFYDYD
ncbi:TPA: hypothetical protein ACGO1T_001884 [Streptococcus suis]